MTLLALTVAVVGLVWLVVSERRWRREQRRWIEERERLDRYGEHIARANGHPHTGHVLAWTEPPDPDDAA